MNTEEMKSDYVHRITHILNCPVGDDMQIDLDVAENMPINSDLPIFLASGILYDTLLELGFPEDDAELARIAFFAFKP